MRKVSKKGRLRHPIRRFRRKMMTSLAKVSIGVKAFIDEHKANGNSAPKVLEKWIEPYLSQCIKRLLVRGPVIRCETHGLTQCGTKQHFAAAAPRSAFGLIDFDRTKCTRSFSRRVVGWSMQSRMMTDLALQALLSAVWRLKPRHRVMIEGSLSLQFQGCQRSLMEDSGAASFCLLETIDDQDLTAHCGRCR